MTAHDRVERTLATLLLEIAETAMPESFFASDSRCEYARRILSSVPASKLVPSDWYAIGTRSARGRFRVRRLVVGRLLARAEKEIGETLVRVRIEPLTPFMATSAVRSRNRRPDTSSSDSRTES
jgi:hypothetical protein